jgi:hypothetical protein
MSCLIEGHRVVNRCHLTDEIEHEPKLEMSLLKNLHTLIPAPTSTHVTTHASEETHQ